MKKPYWNIPKYRQNIWCRISYGISCYISIHFNFVFCRVKLSWQSKIESKENNLEI